jgi:hypothetical protein
MYILTFFGYHVSFLKINKETPYDCVNKSAYRKFKNRHGSGGKDGVNQFT